MNLILINGSPKAESSNSEYFLSHVTSLLSAEHTYKEYYILKPYSEADFYMDLTNADVILFAFPLYMDSLPSHFLQFLIELEKQLKITPCSAYVYVLINCGFYEGVQTSLAIEIMKNWCAKTRLIWGQAIGIGAGEMLGSLREIPLSEGPNKALYKVLIKLVDSIESKQSGEPLYVSPSFFPRFLFLFSANYFWIQRARQNKLNWYDLKRRFSLK